MVMFIDHAQRITRDEYDYLADIDEQVTDAKLRLFVVFVAQTTPLTSTRSTTGPATPRTCYGAGSCRPTPSLGQAGPRDEYTQHTSATHLTGALECTTQSTDI